MIEIKNLTKHYKVKHRNDVVALNDVTFTLPDKGMVFIVGKSGSGKSTLLNMIGGLDSATSGEIVADGNNVLKMSNTKLTKYRSSYVGFIFQDYHILENFTVRQNIELAMDIANKKDEDKINQILQVVDLTLYADRYPSELSGGQKQRISIARALVKDARVILCDEPTGNLDAKTSSQVLDMLKKISQEKLVLVVSHNMVDANNYADRIIELYDGMIVRDRSRSVNYSNEFKIENGIIHIPHYRDLTSHELILINETIQNKTDTLKFKQIDNRFRNTAKINKEMELFNVQSKNITKKTSKKLFRMFFKNRMVSILFSVLLASLLMVCFAIFQSFLKFDGNQELSKTLSKHNITSIPLQKGQKDEAGNVALNNIKHVFDEDTNLFLENGFEGNIYYKFNNTIPINKLQTSKLDVEGSLSTASNLQMFYAMETFGVINCSEEFLKSTFGITGDITYLAKSDTPKTSGIYIPDYVADSILFYELDKTKTYDDLLGEYIYMSGKTPYVYDYINGIFDTNYEKEYEEIITRFKNVSTDPEGAGRLYNEIKSSDLFINFMTSCMNFLGYGYNFEPNYQELIKSSDYRNFLKLNNFSIKNGDNHLKYVSSTYTLIHDDTLKEDEIIISIANYNKFFDTNYETFEDIVSKEVTLAFYSDRSSNGEEIYSKTYKIVGLTKSSFININIDGAEDLRNYDIIRYGIYLDNHQNIEQVMNTATELDYVVCSVDTVKLSKINRVLEIFGKFFLFIEAFFLLVTVIFLVNIGLSSIKKNKYEIGVLKAIGTLNFDIMRIFIRQSLIVCILIIIVANIGIYLGTYAANAILVKAFEAVLNTTFFDLRLINYIPKIVLTDLIYIAGTCLLSFIIPQIFLFRIKPINIIRAKE